MSHLLDIQQLSVVFGQKKQPFYAVENLNLYVNEGEIVGIVGESGSGKSVSMMALMGLVDAPGRIEAKQMHFNGHDLLACSARERQQIIGREIAMVFQNPMSCLDPCYTVGYQIEEVLKVQLGLHGSKRKKRALALMEMVEIPDAAGRLRAYPHQLSGGMCQRVAIAMAMAGEPKLLIADEPTTALDVTIQAQIMDLLVSLQQTQKMSMIMITHDLALIGSIADRVEVMYAGEIVECGHLPMLFELPSHPYTEALLAAIPERNIDERRLHALPGVVPGQYDRPRGCLLSPRCAYVQPYCRRYRPQMEPADNGAVRCYFPLN